MHTESLEFMKRFLSLKGCEAPLAVAVLDPVWLEAD